MPPGTVPFIVSKSNRWCYEKEYRVIKDGKGLEPVPPAWLKGVILGGKMLGDDRSFVESLVKAHPNPPQLYKAKIWPSGYGMDIVAL